MTNIIQFPGAAGHGTPSARGGAGGPGLTRGSPEDTDTQHSGGSGPSNNPINVDESKPGADESVAVLRGPGGEVVSMSKDQEKALQCILGGMAFVFVGIQPTDRGADFFRAAHGDEADLRNAYDHIHNQVDKALAAKGIL